MLKAVFKLVTAPLRFFLSGRSVAYYATGEREIDPGPALGEIEPGTYPNTPLGFRTHGGGIYRVLGKRWLVDVEAYGGEDVVVTGAHDTELGSSTRGANLGYLIRLGFIRVYPFIGVSGDTLDAHIYKAGGFVNREEPDYNQKIAGIEYDGIVWQVGIGGEIKLGGGSGLVLGARAGYIVSQKPIPNDQQGPYVRFYVGGGSFGS